jgi:GntR family transcriptional regulator/MocR family aminotransferase
MREWELSLPVEDSQAPLFARIARALSDEIRRGRLKPGDALPGSRALAETLGVHRNTVLHAYGELEAEGWIASERARGTFVSPSLPPSHEAERRAAASERVGFALAPSQIPFVPHLPPARGVLVLAGGIPDLRLVPVDALARAYRRALRGRGGRRLLDYGDPQGSPRLRAALASLLAATRGLTHGADSLLVTRGSQMGLHLIARALITPGDTVAIEALGYRPAWEAFRAAGARLHPLPVDGEGLDVAALARLAAKKSIRAVYLTPHHHYPTTATLSAGRRLELLALARRCRIAVVEDDYDHEFHYDGRPILPLASADVSGNTVYIGTLSKLLAPGLRIGWVAAPRPLIEQLTAQRLVIDRQGDQAVEHAVAALIEDGELARHAWRARRIYAARRDVLCEELARTFGARLEFAAPSGGLAVWARAHRIDVERWAQRALDGGALFHTARRFAFDGRARPFVRLGFAACDERELREAVRRMRNTIRTEGIQST